MTKIYRGLLLVLTSKFYELILAQRTHIQSFRQETEDPNNYFDIGVLGFWNLMLEVTFTLFSLLCLITGVSLVATLAVIFYPLHALLNYISFIFKNTRNPQVEIPVVNDKINFDESPVIIKNNVKEKE